MGDWCSSIDNVRRASVWMVSLPAFFHVLLVVLGVMASAVSGAGKDAAKSPAADSPPADDALPDAKPVPAMQVIPLPHDQASFRHLGRELTRYHFAATQRRAFWYPIVGPAGRSYTRMGHPHDPVSHSHHNSVWISHNDVGGVSFWADSGKGRIVHRRVEQYFDSPTEAWMLTSGAWQTHDGKELMLERRRACVQPLGVQLEAPPAGSVTLGKTPFGFIGVRMAKTIGVHDGGGRILNSAGQINEKQCFRKPAKWVDYSGPVTTGAAGGITLMDHPTNPDHPTPFHVRGDGWMGACLTLNRPLAIQKGKPLRLRYGLWVHAGVPKLDQIEARWRAFARTDLPPMTRQQK